MDGDGSLRYEGSHLLLHQGESRPGYDARQVANIPRSLLTRAKHGCTTLQVCAQEDSECSACGPCINDGTCTCEHTVTGSVCSGVTTEGASDDARNLWGGDRVVLATWNLFGVANRGETAAQTLARFEEIGDLIRDGSANIVALQECFQSDATQALVNRFAGRLPHMSRQSFGDGPSKNSGLFFASQFPIVEERFEEFSVASGSDALTDKGVYGALVRVRRARMYARARVCVCVCVRVCVCACVRVCACVEVTRVLLVAWSPDQRQQHGVRVQHPRPSWRHFGHQRDSTQATGADPQLHFAPCG